MHKVQKEWCERVKKKFPKYFLNKKVLEMGSLDINGNNRYLFNGCDYIGLDVIPGKNVDVICIAHEYNVPGQLFDTIISTNALEHDIHYRLTLQKMIDLLKPKGFLLISVPNSHPEHGTLEIYPTYSGTSQMGKEWGNYYKNLEEADIRQVIDIDKFFSQYEFSIKEMDLRFWGIKNAL